MLKSTKGLEFLWFENLVLIKSVKRIAKIKKCELLKLAEKLVGVQKNILRINLYQVRQEKK